LVGSLLLEGRYSGIDSKLPKDSLLKILRRAAPPFWLKRKLKSVFADSVSRPNC
jgi:hypothetical protein